MPASVDMLVSRMMEGLQLDGLNSSVLHHQHNKQLDNIQQQQMKQLLINQQQTRLLQQQQQQQQLLSLAQQHQLLQQLQQRRCCTPMGCRQGAILVIPWCGGEIALSSGAVRVGCSNEMCTVGRWMHETCFITWQQQLLNYAKSSPPSLSDDWSSTLSQAQQRLAVIGQMTKCLCGQGHLYRDAREGQQLEINNKLLTADVQKLSVDAINKAVAAASETRMRTSSCSSNESTSAPSSGGHSPPSSPPHWLSTLPYSNISPPLNSYLINGEWRLESESPPNDGENSSQVGLSIAMGNTIDGLSKMAASLGHHVINPSTNTKHVPILGAGKKDLPLMHQTVVHSSDAQEMGTPRYLVPTFKRFPPLHYGNIFQHRTDLKILRCMKSRSRNNFQVRVADEGQHGNDPTRGHLLRHLSRAGVTSLDCVVCRKNLPVFDEFPLVDGTLFFSPRAYTNPVLVPLSLRGEGASNGCTEQDKGLEGCGIKTRKGYGGSSEQMFLNAVCFDCMEPKISGSTRISCGGCGTAWRGETLVVGTVYRYDLFGAMMCCKSRLSCSRCHQPIQDNLPRSFSESSEAKLCQHCGRADYHLIKPLGDIYNFSKIE